MTYDLRFTIYEFIIYDFMKYFGFLCVISSIYLVEYLYCVFIMTIHCFNSLAAQLKAAFRIPWASSIHFHTVVFITLGKATISLQLCYMLENT